MPEIVTIGESMTLLYSQPAMPLRMAWSFQRSIAGAESNVAIGLTRLGHSTSWVGRVGADPFGMGLLDALRAEGVDLSWVVVDQDAPTGVLIRDRHPERPTQVLYYRRYSAGSRLQPGDIGPECLEGARFLHLTGITPALSPSARQAVYRAASLAAELGVEVSFDPNLRLKLWAAEEAAETLAPLVSLSRIVIVGADEAKLLSGAVDEGGAAQWFLAHGAPLVVLKRGPAGSWATDGIAEWEAPPFRVTPVDVIGAGDAFVAGFLAARLGGGDLPMCLRWGNAAGALATQVPGDIEGLPYRRDLEALLEGHADADR